MQSLWGWIATLKGEYVAPNGIIPRWGISSLNTLCLNLTPCPLSLKERGIRGRGL